jgi:histidine triad (HIT) family protein
MVTDTHCIFCKIIAGQIPCHKIFEDDAVLAFLDIGPLVRGHTVVIPKAHHATIMEVPPELLAQVTKRLPAITHAVLSATGTHACHLLVNNGSEAMQSVSHLHFHILPRKDGDNFRIPWNAGTLGKEEGAALSHEISAKIASLQS